MSGVFRWEADCLADDSFAGDFGNGEVALSDKMVTNRKGGRRLVTNDALLPALPTPLLR